MLLILPCMEEMRSMEHNSFLQTPPSDFDTLDCLHEMASLLFEIVVHIQPFHPEEAEFHQML